MADSEGDSDGNRDVGSVRVSDIDDRGEGVGLFGDVEVRGEVGVVMDISDVSLPGSSRHMGGGLCSRKGLVCCITIVY